MNTSQTPPRIAKSLFALCLHEVERDIILGDLEETHFYLTERYGASRAKAWYWSQLVRSLPIFIFRTAYWSLVMLKNYWKLAQRHLVKNGVYSTINILGLGMALAMCIVAYVTYQYDRQYDAFHEHADSVYRINSVKVGSDMEEHWGISPLPLADLLRTDYPGVERVTRVHNERIIVRREEQVFHERVSFVEPDFLRMFSFPIVQGDPELLQKADQIAITKEMAIKYFGDTDPVGQQLLFRFGGGQERILTVAALMADYPENSSIHFTFLAPYELYLSTNQIHPEDWKLWGEQTFVQIQNPAEVLRFEQYLEQFIAIQNAALPDFQMISFYAEPMRALAPHSRTTYAHNLYSNVPSSAIIGSILTALFVLLMTCFNFINLSLITAGRRMKEIGVRKVMGGLRRQLIAQFLGESLLLCSLALLVALAVARGLVPLYDSLWPFMEIELSYRDNLPLLGFLGILMLGTALIAGLYPAYYASSFSSVQILRGKQRLSGASPFMRVLLGFQFCLTILGVGGSIVFAQNARYQERMNVGYARDQLLVTRLSAPEDYTRYYEAVVRNPAVEQVSGSAAHIGVSWSRGTVRYANNEYGTSLFEIGDEYLETAGLKLLAGRAFQSKSEADRTESVIINKTLAHTLGLKEPVGQLLMMEKKQYTIVGVIEDFYTHGFWNPIEPAVLRITPPETYRYLIVRARPENLHPVYDFLEQTWKEIFPETPFGGFYQDEVFAEGVSVSRSIVKMFTFVAIFTLLIAGTGLFALISLILAKRTKEIGIRKALGANALQLGNLINREFVLVVAGAALLAAAGGVYSMNILLDSIYAYHVNVRPEPFVLATLMIMVIAFTAISSKLYRAVTANPVHALRSE